MSASAPVDHVVSALSVYPLKSAAGLARDEVQVEARGLAGDRRWLVAGADGRALTQRDLPRLALVRPEPEVAGGLRLAAPGMDELAVAAPAASAARCTVQVWGQSIDAAAGGAEASTWLSRFLGVEATLAHMDERSERPVSVSSADGAARVWPMSFADELPLLILTEASLAELNRRAPRAVPMNRFRPNVVLRGGAPFDEDLWVRILIGGVELELVKPCGRCLLTTVDQRTGERAADGEPMRTLATFRRTTRAAYAHDEKSVYFGWRAAPVRCGRVRVGDALRVLERRVESRTEDGPLALGG